MPEPTEKDRQFSQRLQQRIQQEIQQHGGIPFSRYMEMALYEPGLGYYVSGLRKLGQKGDFVTAPEISPLFGRTLAAQIEEIFHHSELRSVFELGAGSGKLCVAILQELEARQALPERYYILDISIEMQQRQRQAIKKHLPHLLERVVWLQKWPEKIHAVVLANEVLDAMPVERILFDKQQYWQQFVVLQGEQWAFDYRMPEQRLQKHLSVLPQIATQPHLTEVNLNYLPWFAALYDALESGVLLLIDYGYGRAEYYLPERNQGTLQCFYRHMCHDEVFFYPGLQDITASVDFTAVAEAADSAGFEFEGFVTQKDFLINNGIVRIMEQDWPKLDQNAQLLAGQQLKQLTLPGEMGDKFRVIGFSKNYQPEIGGFGHNDLSYTL